MSGFQPFDPHAQIAQSWRDLPHWEQPGATYFVTFRLIDSLPTEARMRLAEVRDLGDPDAFAWIDRYLDAGHGSCLFADSANAALATGALRHFDGQRYDLGAFVVMPNHVHALVQPTGDETVRKVIHSWKSYLARQLQRTGAVEGSLWQEERFDRIVRDETELRKFDQYIVDNPKVAHLSAGSYFAGRGGAQWLEG